ncbi:MAG: TonB-dependent receptor [Bacteroidales bacterium]|nr:TonB-dependent receptor [Bacteroidales bacterium]
MRRKISIILALISGIIIQMQAQTQNNETGRMARGTIKGQVIDASSGLAMEFVNVVLYTAKDSTILTGTITDRQGLFSISPVKNGMYYIEVNFIGFHKTRLDDIEINRKSPVVDLGKITLRPSNQELKGVEVVAEKDRIEYKIDRKIVNVSMDLSSSGGTAVDVLENTPSVEVDIEGNVSLRGSSSFTVLIDGKPTTLDGNDILKQLPASSIQQIEIITNPSVKYDPEGGSGIINVVMKKRKRNGFNGIINASGGNQNTYSSDFLLNYRKNKTNWYVGGEYSVRNYYSDAIMNRETYGDTTYYVDAERERVWKRNSKSAQAGMDYYITDDQTISLSTRIGEYGFGMDMDSKTESYTDPSTSLAYTLDKSEFNRTGFFWEGNANYDYKIDNEGQKLEIRAFYSHHDDDEKDMQQTLITDSNYDPVNDNSNDVKTREKETSYRIRFNADYVLPIRKTAKLELGIQSKIRQEEIDYKLKTHDPISENVDSIEFADRQFDFRQNIQSAYAIFSKEFSFVSMKAGLRAEYTDRELSNKDTSETYGINRIDLFPSFHLSKKFNKENQLMASYSRRINRPRGWYLDPFLSYRDQYTLRKGNPDLEPEYTDSYDITYLRHFKKGFLSFETFFRQTNNRIERVPELYNENTIIMTFQNVDKDQSFGSELMLNMPVTKWFKFNTSGSLYNMKIFTEENGEEVTREDINWRIRGNTTFEVGKSTKIQLTAFYNGPSITSTGTRGDFFMTSLAVRQDLLNNHLNLVFRVRDIFATRGHESTTDQPNYYVNMQHLHTIPRISLGVTYKINNFKRKPKSMQSEDEGMDMQF